MINNVNMEHNLRGELNMKQDYAEFKSMCISICGVVLCNGI